MQASVPSCYQDHSQNPALRRWQSFKKSLSETTKNSIQEDFWCEDVLPWRWFLKAFDCNSLLPSCKGRLQHDCSFQGSLWLVCQFEPILQKRSATTWRHQKLNWRCETGNGLIARWWIYSALLADWWTNKCLSAATCRTRGSGVCSCCECVNCIE